MSQYTSYARHPVTLVWAILMAATVTSWMLGTNHGIIGGDNRFTTVAVLIIAFVKVHLVGRHFMELRHAPAGLTRLFNLWVVSVCGMVIGLYLYG